MELNLTCEQFPTEDIWDKLQKVLKFSLPYNKIAQTFNPITGLTDVWRDVDFYEKDRKHPTQKPLKLIKRLISASSNKGDRVLDPFGGSGTTLIACKELGRKCVIIEKDGKYIESIKNRLANHSSLFS